MTEHNLFQEISEDLQRQKLEENWRKYGPFLIGLAFLIILATSVFTAWASWQKEIKQTSTERLLLLADKEDQDLNKKIQSLNNFAINKNGTGQATLARLHAAALSQKQGDSKNALSTYGEISNDHSVDPSLRQLATLYMIEIEMDSVNPTELVAKIEPLVVENAPWRASALELKGHLLIAQNKIDQAKISFSELANDASVPHEISARAKLMLRYLEN